MTDATVRLWGRDIGAVSWLEDRDRAVFQYMPDFADSGIRVAPIMMPPGREPFEFPGLPREAFKGLPGMLADALPDRFGNALIDAWLAAQGRAPGSFNPVERLCYIGSRGMGALEFHPSLSGLPRQSRAVEIDALTRLANDVLNQRGQLAGALMGDDDRGDLEDILRVGTSAGGARAKAVLAWNEQTGEFRSGQVKAGEGFSAWLIKFDGISDNRDKELADPQGFGLVEYAFHLLAVAAGIDMSACRIHREGGRAHFMTRRFDRTSSGGKLHMQSLAALRHFDFNAAGAHSYEQAVETIRLLGLPALDIEQQFRRAVFNVLIRNQDDHVKNIAFLMNRKGEWRLSPAFDVSYAYNPQGSWTHQHQMSLNGKRDHFEAEDFVRFGAFCGIKPTKARELVAEIRTQVEGWMGFAERAGVPERRAVEIGRAMRA
ncbi:type II toxin-antitoxin system HipA family toxin [Luteimonas sp. MC1825]|uniref:type II toxin-antitoxin system HipA family toxin n=1 Tax=Luteimonas sp. MC1825 TaxID=2761107 RepID=UPI00160E9B55|nr:type II toxin-antitoxin system HipA family toxin [Luteimonas sp. MC1825]MBB6599061.1 type II toxin-antitoxin system HipA family toxin [Luteimonas sp. MC1825]QOC89192.1 type II toxin-antitoxin system HipA family toxin [Luteimonas sp. MC1825]